MALPRPSHVVSLAVAAVAAGVLLPWIGWLEIYRPAEFSALMLAGILTSLPVAQIAQPGRYQVVAPSFVVEFTTLLLFGPMPAGVVAFAGALTRGLSEAEAANRAWRTVIDTSTVLLALLTAGWVHVTLGGGIGGFAWPRHALPIAAAATAYVAITGVFTDAILPLARKERVSAAWRSHARDAVPAYVIGASIAVVFAEIMARRAWEMLPLAALPVFLAFRIYRDHVARVDHEQRQRDTLATLTQNVNEQARTIASLRQQTERLSLAAEGANDGLWQWDLSTHEFSVTTRWKEMIGLPAAAVVDKPEEWLRRVHADDVDSLKEALEKHLANGTGCFRHEHRIRHEDGTYRSFQCRGLAARRGGQRAARIAGSLTDATALATTQEQLRDAVFLDPLTGLSNRAVFVEGLGRRLNELKRRPGHDRFALLYLDLDRFKIVNDSLGHLVGDELLIAVSRRLESCLRQGDVLARLGGDEFAILLNGLHSEQQANAIAFRVQEALSKPFSIGGREVFTSASIGIAFGLPQYTTPDEIMHDADTAMYHAKTRGKARHEVFDADMDARVRDRLGLENDLRRAVNNNDFDVHYQPIVLLSSGMCVGFESLVRWNREGKPVSPAIFIPIAEELGLIEQLGTRVLLEACRTFAEWKRQFTESSLEYITVNVSSRQLMQQNFLSIVEHAVRQAGLRPSDLRIEITETALLTSPQDAAEVLAHLRQFGAKIYLDDFGTGYSSLSHLHKLPVDALKIDRSFVRSLQIPDRPAIVESILALARTLNTSVVAEGIESEVQARELERLGCTHAQGYLFSRPLSTQAAGAILPANRPLGPKSVERPERGVVADSNLGHAAFLTH